MGWNQESQMQSKRSAPTNSPPHRIFTQRMGIQWLVRKAERFHTLTRLRFPQSTWRERSVPTLKHLKPIINWH